MKKPTKLQLKISKILIIFVISILLFVVAFLIYEFIKSDEKVLYDIIISIMTIGYLLMFDVFLILLLTKYKREFKLGEDIPFIRISILSLFIFMIIVGLIDILIFKTWKNVYILIMGLALLINEIILNKRYKK